MHVASVEHMSAIRSGLVFLAISVVLGLVWFAIMYGSPLMFIALSWLLIIDVVAALVLAGLMAWMRRWAPPLVAIWVPAVVVSLLAYLALNGFFIPSASNEEWWLESLKIAAVMIGLPALLTAAIGTLRVRKSAAEQPAA